jgi:hypothetical protein
MIPQTRRLCCLGSFLTVALAAALTLAADPPAKSPATEPERVGAPSDQPPSAPDQDGPRWRRGEGRHEPPRPFFDRLPEEERERVRTFLSEHFPEAAGELRRQWHANPEMAERQLQRIMPEILRLMRSYEQDSPELFALRIDEFKNELEMRKLMRMHRTVEESDREELREQLKTCVERAFDLRQQIGRMELQRLERGIADLRQRLENDAQNRDQIITRELGRRLSPMPDDRPGRPHRPGPPPELGPPSAPSPPPNPPPAKAPVPGA